MHLETVTQDYVTNGLPHDSIHELHNGKYDYYGFTGLIHRVELHKTPQNNEAVIHSDVMTVLSDHVDHVSRSHVLLETEQQGRSSFTSQYVANHLQDLIASPSGKY